MVALPHSSTESAGQWSDRRGERWRESWSLWGKRGEHAGGPEACGEQEPENVAGHRAPGIVWGTASDGAIWGGRDDASDARGEVDMEVFRGRRHWASKNRHYSSVTRWNYVPFV